jgi:hypothetical protein
LTDSDADALDLLACVGQAAGIGNSQSLITTTLSQTQLGEAVGLLACMDHAVKMEGQVHLNTQLHLKRLSANISQGWVIKHHQGCRVGVAEPVLRTLQARAM